MAKAQSRERPPAACSQKLTVELQAVDALLPLDQRPVPLQRIASRIVTGDQTALERLLDLDDTLVDRLLRSETQVFV